jgi:hypothetical protein
MRRVFITGMVVLLMRAAERQAASGLKGRAVIAQGAALGNVHEP